MTTVRTLIYTSEAEGWHALLRDLGFTERENDGGDWRVVASDGLVAVHAVPAGDPLDGSTELQVLVHDLDRTIERITALGLTIDRTILDDGDTPLVRVTTDDGVPVSVLPGPVEAAGDVVVLPIWYRRSQGAGRAALHEGDSPAIELSLEVADPDALAATLLERGRPATVVDEAYNRTLLVATPDRGDLWVNGPIDDLYGYRRLDASS